MKTNISYEATRRAFLQTCAMGLGMAGLDGAVPDSSNSATPAPSANSILRIEPDSQRCWVPALSWDTEGGERFRRNLLRKGTGLGLRVRTGGQWKNGVDLPTVASGRSGGAQYQIRATPESTIQWDIDAPPNHFEMSLSAAGSATLAPDSVEMVFPFDPMVTPTTVLPADWHEDGSFELPLVITAPDFGQMLLRVSPASKIRGRLEGSRDNHFVDLILELPQLDRDHKYTFSLTPVILAPPQGLQDESLWRLARRGWFNAFQPSARWGEQNRAFSSPPGILGNNVLSDPCSLSLIFYADQMLWTPTVAEGISVAPLVRLAVEFWLDQRTHMNGEVVGYWDYANFLDANTGPVICGWDYVEATGDLAWLEKRISRLEFVAEFLARRDQDLDGIVEATQSGNANTFFDPDRSCTWFDGVNHGWKDAYCNAEIYRAWRCLAELESKLHREEKRRRYAELADRLKAAYARVLYNPQTGWIADWRSEDGHLHDYASFVPSSMAIEYGLVDVEQGKKMIEKLWAKMQTSGFTRYELGIPPNFDPIHRFDCCQGSGSWCPTREDGTDTFQRYQNGGISAGHTLHFLVANYLLGQGEKADQVLRAMLGRQQGDGFQNGVQNVMDKGIDWTTWDGQPCGYEGYLADVYYFLMAVLLRQPSLRERFYRPLQTS
jgi:hypothetical protein